MRLSPKFTPRHPLSLWVLMGMAVVCATACSPRYSIHEVRSPGFEAGPEAYRYEDSTLVVAYDFWSFAGEPYVSFYNDSDDTLELDLRVSRVSGEWGTEPLASLLGGGRAGLPRLAANYPQLAFRADGGALLLLPRRWHSFYGVPQHTRNSFGGKGRVNRNVYDYTIISAAGARTYTHVFTDRVRTRMWGRAFRHFEGGAVPGNVYYLDRGPQRGLLAVEVLTALSGVVVLL